MTENDPQPQIAGVDENDSAHDNAASTADTIAAAADEATSDEVVKPEETLQQTNDSGAPFMIDTAESLKTNDVATEDKNGVDEEAATDNNTTTKTEQGEEQQEQKVIKKVVPPLPLDWTKMAECNEQEDIAPADAI
eukprot:scaffold18902_cov67-Skeletonema_dohrnii-CCMP3373.AAC.1